jgi:ribulose-5-phosphate 4-epimerase/fuculose-1-phosphate aldolase
VHPTYTVAAMHAGIDIREASKNFPELKRYTRVGPMVPVCDAGSLQLTELTSSHLRGGSAPNDDVQGKAEIIYDIVGQKGHGVCAVAKHPWDAFEHIERLEHICQILLNAQNSPHQAWHKNCEIPKTVGHSFSKRSQPLGGFHETKHQSKRRAT